MTTKERMNTNRKTTRIVGVLFLLATVTYMAGNGLLDSILSAPDYLINVYPDKAQVTIGVLLEYVDAAAVFGIGVMLFPILRKHNETIAIGYLGTRILECAMLIVSGISSLSLIPLSQEYAQAGVQGASYFQTSGALLVAESGLAFQIAMLALGLGSVPFCFLLYKSQLIPRSIAVLGVIGCVALLTSALLVVFGYSTGVTLILFLPGALFEIIFPIWLIVKGFNSSAIAAEPGKTDIDESGGMSLSKA